MEENVKVVNLTEGKDGTFTEEARWKTRLRAAKDWAKRKIASGYRWCCDNKGDLIILVPLGLATINGVKNTMAPKKTNAQLERDRVEKTYYDRRTGIYWNLKRPMRTWEKEELCRRQREGEYTEQILRDFRILA